MALKFDICQTLRRSGLPDATKQSSSCHGGRSFCRALGKARPS